MTLNLQPIDFSEATVFIKKHHRHHLPPVGCKFCIGINDGNTIRGVIIVGRPVARNYDNGYTAEVTRCCTDGVKNGCSMLYAAAWRAARAMGYKKLITYILKSESGGSLVASGWKCIGETKGGSWSCESRPRIDKHPLEPKFCFCMESEAGDD